jgi:hypothetical protein
MVARFLRHLSQRCRYFPAATMELRRDGLPDRSWRWMLRWLDRASEKQVCQRTEIQIRRSRGYQHDLPLSIVRLPPMVGRRLGADIGELSEIWVTTQVTVAGLVRAEERRRHLAAVTPGHGWSGRRASRQPIASGSVPGWLAGFPTPPVPP